MFLIFLHIICYDVWFYISHVILHEPSIYFIHKLHHKKKHNELIYIDANEGHLIEHIIQPLGIFVPCFYVFSPLQLTIAFLIVGARALMRHDNRFSWLIGNHHLLHHKYQKYNFGEYWIDTIVGSDYPDKKKYIYGMIYT